MELHLRIVGFIFLLLASIHLQFPRRFAWKENLQGLSLINKEMMYVHTFFVALIVLLMGLLCVCCPAELLNTSLGRKICFGLFVFWLIRLYVQFFVYSSALWKKKRFETIMHLVFSIIWIYATLVFLIASGFVQYLINSPNVK
jgi:hypothetical protein